MVVRIEDDTGDLVAELIENEWALYTEEVEERHNALPFPVAFVSSEEGDVDIVEDGEELPKTDPRFAWDLARPTDVVIVTNNGAEEKGGAGSGHHGHHGAPGVGGSSAFPGYVARTTAMKELGIGHASKMNQYFHYGMPSIKQGGRRYVKWPEAQLWMNSYEAAGKGKAGIEAGNRTMRSRGIPVGKHPPLPPPPPPSTPLGTGAAMKKLGVAHYSRMHAYKKYGMPTMIDPKTGKEAVKWPEAQLWYERYDAAGRGRKGIDEANYAVYGTTKPGQNIPKPPAPPKPPDRPDTGQGSGPYAGEKVWVNSSEGLGSTNHVKHNGFGEGETGTTRDGNEVKRSMRRLPQEHIDTIRAVRAMTVAESNERWGANWGDDVGGWMDRKGQMGLMYSDGGRKKWTPKTVIHEAGHGVYTTLSRGSTYSKVQSRAQSWFGTKKERLGITKRIKKAYGSAKAGKKGHHFPTLYSRTDFEEFFCECYAHYVTKPSRLFITNRPMYDLMRNDIFGGAQYTDHQWDATVK